MKAIGILLVILGLIGFVLGGVTFTQTEEIADVGPVEVEREEPLILSFASEIELGTVLSLLGIGMVSGGVLMTAFGGPKHLVAGIVAATTIQGLAFVAYGLTTSIPLLATATFVYGTALTIIRGTNQTLWQRKVPADVLGRVMSFRSAVTGLPYPIAFVTAGILADQVFTPAVATGGRLSDLAGVIAGPAPGTALLIVLSGLLTIAFCAAAWFSPHVRRLEAHLPDAHAQTPAVSELLQPSGEILPES